MTDRFRDSTDPRSPLRGAWLVAVLLSLFVFAPAARADWLITTDGERIQTIGPWQAEGDSIAYLDVGRDKATLAAASINLEASRKATMDSQDVVLYSTGWCGYCRRTRALLNELGVDFLEKDIEISEVAQREYIELVGSGSGVPVLKIENDVIRGYQPDVIKSRTDRLD